MNCAGLRNVKIVSNEEFERTHTGHKITRNFKTVKAPGYRVIFDRCEDCKVVHGKYDDNKGEKPR